VRVRDVRPRALDERALGDDGGLRVEQIGLIWPFFTGVL
jgi:hypothetical protein